MMNARRKKRPFIRNFCRSFIQRKTLKKEEKERTELEITLVFIQCIMIKQAVTMLHE